MKARLKVLSGGSAGKELTLKPGKFLIGRSDSCHLRPRSDAVSRKHCVLFIDEDSIRARDLKSRNGTLVNGEKIAGDTVLTSGDKITVGPLEFEISITSDAPAAPVQAPAKPVAQPAKPSPNKTAQPAASEPKKPEPEKVAVKSRAEGGGAAADDDIFGWLDEGDEVDRVQRASDPSTRHFKVDAPGDDESSDETIDLAKKGGDTSVSKKDKKKEKKEPGKLPPVPEKSMENSQAAAADALKQFFKRA